MDTPAESIESRREREVPTLYVMVGLPAAGKTFRAKEIERSVGALRLTPDEWMLPLFETLVDMEHRDILEGRFIWLARSSLQLGVNVILDLGVWSRNERSALKYLAAESGARFELVYLDAGEESQRQNRDLRESAAPHTTIPLSDEMLAEYRSRFEVPGQDELTGAANDSPPAGFATWTDWMAERWPTSFAIENASTPTKDA